MFAVNGWRSAVFSQMGGAVTTVCWGISSNALIFPWNSDNIFVSSVRCDGFLTARFQKVAAAYTIRLFPSYQ